MRPTRGQIWSYFRSSSGTSASSSSFCTSCTVTLFFLPKTIPIFVLLWAQLLSITAVENHIYSTLHVEWDAQISSIFYFYLWVSRSQEFKSGICCNSGLVTYKEFSIKHNLHRKCLFSVL